MSENIILEIYKRLYSFYGNQHWWPGESPFEISIGAILTQNTNWSNVERAIENIKRANLLSPEKMYKIPKKDLSRLIRPAGYYNVKAERIKAFVKFLIKYYNGNMDKMKAEGLSTLRKKLLSVHGIGPETADSILLYALNMPVFVIDAYTKRIFSRHGVMNYNATYDEYQSLFHKELDEDVKIFNEYHALIVRVAKDFCKPKPKCEGCPLKLDILFPNE
jgi:endonuclease-3 related protein